MINGISRAWVYATCDLASFIVLAIYPNTGTKHYIHRITPTSLSHKAYVCCVAPQCVPLSNGSASWHFRWWGHSGMSLRYASFVPVLLRHWVIIVLASFQHCSRDTWESRQHYIALYISSKLRQFYNRIPPASIRKKIAVVYDTTLRQHYSNICQFYTDNMFGQKNIIIYYIFWRLTKFNNS